MKPGRNDPCPCGSGKKFKKCCIEKHEAQARAGAQAAVLAAEETRRQEAAHQHAEEKAWIAAREEQRKNEPPPPVDLVTGAETEADASEPDWPPLAEADQRIVDAWWDKVSPVYTGKSGEKRADWLLGRALEFLDQHAPLFRYLYLHEEFLFELGAYLARAGRMSDYVALLKRLRREQPVMYRQCFGYYDRDIIAELICVGDRAAIPACLDLFKQHPSKDPDQLLEVIDLLAWRGLEAELRELLEGVVQKTEKSRGGVSSGFILTWLTYLAMWPFLEAGDTSDESIQNLRAAMLGVRPWKPHELRFRNLARVLRLASHPAADAGLDLTRASTEQFYEEVAWGFTGWLHRRKALNWTAARFLADKLIDYWNWKDPEKGGSVFRLHAEQVDNYIVRACRGYFWLDGVDTVGTLQAMVWFADYLAENSYFGEADARNLQSEYARLYDRARPGIDACEPALRICPTYESLIAAPRSGHG